MRPISKEVQLGTDITELSIDVSEAPPEEARPILIRKILPSLDLADWVSRMVSSLEEGEYCTYGDIAKGLGDLKAARAVAEVVAKGKVKGPIQRIFRSDEKVDGTRVTFATSSPLTSLALIQKRMKRDEGPSGPFKRVAGVDVSYDDEVAVGSLCVHDGGDVEVFSVVRKGEALLPYIPGYLFFREAPILVPLIMGSMDYLMDTLVLVDGNGILHPRRMGTACQLGIVCQIPTCGVAKKLMLGSTGPWAGRPEIAVIKEGDEVLGAAIKNGRSKPVYASVGNSTCLSECLPEVLNRMKGRLPSVLMSAHLLANKERIRIRSGPS